MSVRVLAAVLGAVLALGFARLSEAAAEGADPDRGIAVAPFAADGAPVPDVASRLAQELAVLSPTRIVPPGSLLSDGGGLDEPEAGDVRRWAERNDVDNVIVGRTRRAPRGGLDVSVELRSGHSGAARAEYRLAPDSDAALPGAVDHLARLILADLGDPVDAGSDALPDVAAPAPTASAGAPGSGASEQSGAKDAGVGLAMLPGVRRDDPIQIHSDELEVLPQDGGRRLVFSRNVEVHQGNIILNADRLEAVYAAGASQPDLLLASGRVRVAQGGRRARCERARYEREAQTLVCRGQAEVLEGCDRVRGEEISFDLSNERVMVTGAASVVIQPKVGDSGGACADGSAPPSKVAP